MILRFPQPRWNIDATTLGYIAAAIFFSIGAVMISIGLWFGANSQGVF